MTYRIHVQKNHDWIEEGSNGDRLPEPREYYEANPIAPDGRAALTYDKYLDTYGNPNRYTGYFVTVESQCPHCGEWRALPDSGVGTSLYDTYVKPGYYAMDDPKLDAYIRELAAEMLPEGE